MGTAALFFFTLSRYHWRMIDGGTFARGETVSFLAGVVAGDAGGVSALPIADLKAMYGCILPSENAPVKAALTVTHSPSSGDIPEGWIITLTDEQSAALLVGDYVFDIRCVIEGGIYISEPVKFRLIDGITLR